MHAWEDNDEALRRAAEARVSSHEAPDIDALDEAEVRRLLHELQVHQIELEIQNEELREGQQRLLVAHDALKRSREGFYRLYHDAPVGYVTLSASGIVLQTNALLAEMCGRAIESIESRHFVDLLHPADHAQFRHRFAAFFKSPQGKTMELRIRSMDGDMHYVLFKGRLPEEREGLAPVADGVHFSLTNITERKQTEDKLNRERGRLEAIIAGTSEGFWLIGPDKCTLQVNAALCRMLGYAHEEMIGRAPWEFTDEANAAIFHRETAKIRATDHRTYEIELRAKDGRAIPTLFNASSLRGPDGELEAAFAFVSDTSERKGYEAHLIEARHAAEAANRAKSAFLANMSHELRTPLNAIMGYAQVLERDASLDPDHRHKVAQIHGGGEYLLTLINDILDLAKIEAGRFDLFPEPVALRGFLRELVDIFRPRMEEKDLAFGFEVAAAVPHRILADPKRLRQILMNLLGNAAKFTAAGQIALRAGVGDGWIVLQVEDTGPGILPEQQAEIFKPFSQAGDAYSKSQGTGLGLSISARLAMLMGGEIGFESKAGKGSTFFLRLPVTLAEDSGDEEPDRPRTGPAPATGYQRTDGDLAPLRILIVDDVADNRTVLNLLLHPLGFEVQESEDGESCLEVVQSWRPDLILMDLRMPGMGGIAATRALHQVSGLGGTPVIAVSASAYPEDREGSREAGCVGYISKPVDLEVLHTTLAACLPLKWIRPVADSTSQADRSAGPPLSAEHAGQLRVLVHAGAITKIRRYLEELAAQPECPTEARELLNLARLFKMKELRERLG